MASGVHKIIALINHHYHRRVTVEDLKVGVMIRDDDITIPIENAMELLESGPRAFFCRIPQNNGSGFISALYRTCGQ